VFDGVYQGKKNFIEKVNDLEKELKTKKTQIESELTNALKDTLELNLGFKPTIKNMAGVIMANAEAFLRILDEVHKNAWNKRDDPTRRRAIIDSVSNSTSVDRPKIARSNSPVFPWPQFIVEDNTNPSKTTYQIKYPGDYPAETGSNDYNICVIASSQLSRSVESRGGDKKPILSDLRESGAIEQDADKVLFIYRPAYYGLTHDESGESTENRVEIIIAKNRNGALDTARLMKDNFTTHFSDFHLASEEFIFAMDRLKELNDLHTNKDEPF
jgi:hypothetical protein